MADDAELYNYTLTISREQDAEFAAIARERTARHPLRTYLKIPLLRSFAMWFTPRVELLPNSSPLRPVWSEWEDDRLDFLVTLGLGLVNAAYVILALAGAWMVRGRPGVALLIVFIVGAHALYRRVSSRRRSRATCWNVSRRCIALAAQVFARPRAGAARQLSSTGSG